MGSEDAKHRRAQQLAKCANLLLPIAIHGFHEQLWSWGELFCYALRKPAQNYYELFVSAVPPAARPFLLSPPREPEVFDITSFSERVEDIGGQLSSHQVEVDTNRLVANILSRRTAVHCKIVWFFSVRNQDHWSFLTTEVFDETGVVECPQEQEDHACKTLRVDQPYDLAALLDYLRDTGRTQVVSESVLESTADRAVFGTPVSLLSLLSLLGLTVEDRLALHDVESEQLWEGVNWAMRRYVSNLPSEPPTWLRNMLKPFTPR